MIVASARTTARSKIVICDRLLNCDHRFMLKGPSSRKEKPTDTET